MMKYAAIFFLMTTSVARAAFGKNAPPKVSQTCVACHGKQGISPNPLWPNLAGQKERYLIQQLSDFQTGRRKDPLMTPVAKTLSEQDIKILATYFSSLK